MLPQLSNSTLLVHIAFHYVSDRRRFLEQVLLAVYDYPLRSIQVVIDSNTEDARSHDLPRAPDHVQLRIDVHPGLDHPFLLTWQHRKHMAEQRGNYDYFMYVEDDIVVPRKAIERWHREAEGLYRHGFLFGFLRTERTASAILVSSDQLKPARSHHIRFLNGKPFFAPRNPYHGFWIYHQRQMDDFAASPCWRDGNRPGWGVRERAAAGMIWRKPKRHRTLVPLEPDLTVPQDVLVAHLPNNYALNPDSDFGKIPIDELTTMSLLDKLILRGRLLWTRSPS